jgi:hypothetical protein
MRGPMKKLLFAGLALSTMLRPQAGRQEEKLRALAVPASTVRVVAYEANGRYLGAPDISTFVDAGNQQDLAAKFRGGVATAIPYGVYRVEGKQPWYYPDERYVRVYQPSVTIVLGLRFASELPEVPPTLPGRVVGLTGPADRIFAKLIGVYENVSMEAAVDAGGKFTLGGLAPGAFILLIVNDQRILASRTLTIPYTGPPLEIEVGTNRVGGLK